MDEEIFSLADKVIETLKRKKILEFGELASEVDGDKKHVRRIVELLERQGMVSIEYKLTKVVVAWNDVEPVPAVPIAYNRYKIISVDHKETAKEAETLPKAVTQDELPFITKEVEFEEKALKKGKKTGKETKAERLEKKIQRVEPTVSAQLSALRRAREKELEKVVKETTEKEKLAKEEKEWEGEREKGQEKMSGSIKGPGQVSTSKGERKSILSEYLHPETIEIDKSAVIVNEEDYVKTMADELRIKLQSLQHKKAEIAELNRKKAGISEEYYAPLSQRIETETMIIADIVADKEQKIKKLKEKLKSLPEKISEIDIDTIELRNAELEARCRFNETVSSLEEVIKEIKEIQKSAKTEISASRETLNNQLERMNQLKNRVEQYLNTESDLEKRIASMQNKIEKETAEVAALDEELENVGQIGSGLQTRVGEVEGILEEGRNRLGQIESEVKNLTKLDMLVKEVKLKYTAALEELDKEIKDEETEMMKLREIVEGGVARKYLSELEKMQERHDAEIVSVVLKEQEINQQLEKKKEELKKMIRQCKELSNQLYSSLPKKSFDIKDIEKRIDEKLDKIEEKDLEKGKQIEERRNLLGELGGFISGLKKK